MEGAGRSEHTEVARLPGCGHKIAILFEQWDETGQLREVAEAARDPKMAVLQTFYNVWGVGDTTAREFYKRGWRDLDDVVEHGWSSLSRVQQIGVKYYDELLRKIPRGEVEAIADRILSHARRVDVGFQMVIVGGHRRGQRESGDVDVVLSHPDEDKTLFAVGRLVMSLEKEGYVTHTLSLSNRNSERGQTPVPWRGEGRMGSGFDTLDKALIVWRDAAAAAIGSPSSSSHSASTPPPPPPPNHRRVDIIISPWKTVGCAVLGWSGGTTFQRDLRRYCKAVKGLKFDSSGVRSRGDGRWIDMEKGEGDESIVAGSMEEAERRVFRRLGLEWRRPEERCTG